MEQTILHIERYVPTVLSAYVECFSVYHFQKGASIRLYPKGVFEMVFQSNDCFEHHTAYSDGWEARPKNFIGGLFNKSYLVKPQGVQNICIAVEFKPHTAKYFVPDALSILQNQVVDIREIWGSSAIRLLQRIHKEVNSGLKVKYIEDFLVTKLLPFKKSIIDTSVSSIKLTKGFVEISQLAKEANLSSAQFRKRFREEIGIAPSQYCKIVRINTTLSILENQYDQSLTNLAYQLGYFDQAHFIKDFKSIVGTSPKAFKKAV